jgi:hypothetical protein
MKESLEDFVKAHRNEFDSFEPRPDLWQDICEEITPPENKKPETKITGFNSRYFLRYAAAAVLLLATGFGLRVLTQKGSANDMVAQAPVSLQKVAPEMAEVENYYTMLISQKQEELNSFDLAALEMDEDWHHELAQLDSSYQKLKKELLTHPDKEKVVAAMTRNLRIRIEMLNRQLQVLERINTIKNQPKNETHV